MEAVYRNGARRPPGATPSCGRELLGARKGTLGTTANGRGSSERGNGIAYFLRTQHRVERGPRGGLLAPLSALKDGQWTPKCAPFARLFGTFKESFSAERARHASLFIFSLLKRPDYRGRSGGRFNKKSAAAIGPFLTNPPTSPRRGSTKRFGRVALRKQNEQNG